MITQHKIEASHQDAIKKSKRARIARTIFILVIVASLGGLLIINAITLDRVQTQSAQQQAILQEIQKLTQQQKQNTDDLRKAGAEQLDKQTHYIECIAKFFANHDRANSVLTDLEACQVQKVSVSPSAPTVADNVVQKAPQQATAIPNPQPEPLANDKPADSTATGSAQATQRDTVQPAQSQNHAPTRARFAWPLVDVLKTAVSDIVRL